MNWRPAARTRRRSKPQALLRLRNSALIAAALEEIGKTSEQQAGYFDDPEAEDVHHFVEKKLVALIGETGKKLHSGRSRNEQIATDLRLFVRDSVDNLRALLGDLLEALLDRATESKTLVMPAYTHLAAGGAGADFALAAGLF